MAQRSRGPWWLAASLRAYHLSLWLYPAPFRRAWGTDMAQLFGDLVAQAWRCRGLRGVLALWATTLADLAVSLAREHGARLVRPLHRHRNRWRRQAAFARAMAPAHDSIGPGTRTGRPLMQLQGAFRQLFIRRHLRRRQIERSLNVDGPRFEKFTKRARTVMQLAQAEAQGFRHNYMGTEHLLLGLVREGEGVGAQVLREMGVYLGQVRHNVEFIIGHGDREVHGEIGLTPRAKKVVELAVDEARQMGHHYIGTEHLLLGLVREGEGIAAGVLCELGVRLERVREETLRILAEIERRKREAGGMPPAAPPPDA